MRLLPTLLAVVLAAQPVLADKRLDDAVRKADAQLAKGKQAEAVKILQKEASRSPRDPEPPLALARMYLRLGQLELAAPALAKAGKLAGAAPAAVRSRVRVSQSTFALRAGGALDAESLARDAVAASATPESLAALARAQARLGQTLAARETAERAAQASPDNAAVQLARGDAQLSARLAEAAVAAYRRAVTLDPGSAAAGSGLALALASRGEAAAALESARAALRADPHFAEAQAAIGLAHLAADPEDPKSEAVAAAYQAVSLEPTNPLVKLALARAMESRGQLEQAEAVYREAAALDPTWPAPQVAALALRLRLGDAEAALAGLRALPASSRASAEAQLLLGRLLVEKQDWPAALAALDQAVSALPGLAQAHALRGLAAYNAGELSLAADCYGRAAELDPANSGYLTSYALRLSDDGRREEGLAAMLRATEGPAGQQPELLMQLGELYRSFQPPRVQQAVAAYEAALKLDPKDGRPALEVAMSYRAGQQWTRAISAYERVSQSFPRLDGEALLGTAWCYYWSDDLTRAKFYTGLAVRGGADVSEIRQAFSRPPGSASAARLAELRDELRSKNAGVQARAVQQLLELGRPGVPALAAALGRASTSIAARERIVAGLERQGAAAREALPQLDRLAGSAPIAPDALESGQAAVLREREARLVVAARAAATAIRAQSP